MIKNIYFYYPIILGLLPVHSLYAQNISEIARREYIQVCVFLTIALTIGLFIVNFFIQNADLAALIMSFIYFALLYENYFKIAFMSDYKKALKLNSAIFDVVYCVLVFIISSFLFIFLKNSNILFLSKTIFWLSIFITFFILVDILKKENKIDNTINDTIELNINYEDKPDIYQIIFDTHNGFDNKENCDYDFKDALEKRGFKIYTKCKSNYNRTMLSVPSMLNMDYVQNIIEDKPFFFKIEQTSKYYADNKIWKLLKKSGYNLSIVNHFLLSKLFKKSYFTSFDTIYTKQNTVGLKRLLIFSSIFKVNKKRIEEYKYSSIQNCLDFIYKHLKNIKNDTPQYFFMHILAPHLPYFFYEDGKPIPSKERLNNTHYFSYEKYTNKKIISLIDEIMTNMKKNSIIILHGDHGVHDLDSQFKVLCAIYYPPKYSNINIPQNATLVNIFRYIFNNVFSTKLEILENKLYETNDIDFIVKDVSHKLKE